ncbi:hypothetical protein CYMTET_14154 [Cymbomonas tetramitiformis]|uniref:Tudor domain-containing protein n=1 Tax=Cymbomonas tetramitiformis TaxID=36881 RepID=A0AAE0LAN1_9CHLO|nr:hypothetical protein CYMTET_14154 [Cymbomonas tetramitiformis]
MHNGDAEKTAMPGEAERLVLLLRPQDGYHCVGIPDFQKYMQFEVQGKLDQCNALPFGWNDSPRIFVKFMKARLKKITSKATDPLLYLRELYFVLAEKRSWGAKVKLTRQSFGDLEWWKRLQAQCNWNGRRIWRCPMRAKLHTDSSLCAWGGVLYLKLEARGFWCDELHHLHITHLELEAVFKTAQSEWGEHTVDRFASEVSAQLLSYYAQWWDPHCEGVDALAYGWRGKANWINPLWGLLDEVAHKLREEGTGGHGGGPVLAGPAVFRELEAIADEASSGSAAWPVPAVGAQLEKYWPLDDDCYKGTVTDVAGTGQHHIQYDDGDKEWLQLSEELTRLEQWQEAEENNDVAPVNEWTSALRERWRGELGVSRFTELAVQMQEQALKEMKWGNYGPKSKKFKDFCEGEGREWLPASEETVRLYLAMLLDRAYSTLKGATTCARAVRVVMEKVCFLGGWAQLSAAMQAYIDPTAVPDQAVRSYFGWLAPQGICAQEF